MVMFRYASFVSLYMLVLSSTAHANESCETNLTLRSVTPVEGATDVPVNARILVSFIGWGSADEFSVKLESLSAEVSTTNTSWCYAHEGPYEVHCWWSLTPDEQLVENSEYRLSIETTDSYGGPVPMSFHSRFFTGDSVLTPITASLDFYYDSAWNVDTEDRVECDFEQPRRYFIDVETDWVDPSNLSVFHFFELPVEENEPAPLVHTVFAQSNGDGAGVGQIKQYVDGSRPYSDCFAVTIEDGAGNRTPWVNRCVDGDSWVDEPDGDTSPDDTAGNSEMEGDSGEDDEPPYIYDRNGICGCSASQDRSSFDWLHLFGLLPLVAFALRRR